MALKFTGDQIVRSVRNSGMFPDTASLGTTDDDILEHAEQAMAETIIPHVMRFREEYFVVTERQTITSASKYRINHRAIASKVRDVLYVDSSGSRRYLDMVPREELAYTGSTSADEPTGFYVEGHHIVLYPDLGSASGSIEISFFFRPGQLVKSEDARQITSLDTSTKTVNFASNVPTSWSTSNKFDIHSGNSGAEIHEWSLTAATVSGSQIVFSDEIDGSTFGRHTAEVGDWVCLEEEAALPGIPRELHPALVQATVVRLLQSVGDFDGLKLAAQKLNRVLGDEEYMLNPRVDGKPKIINNRNSLLGSGARRGIRPNSFGTYL